MYSRRRFLQVTALIAVSTSLVKADHYLWQNNKKISFTIAGSRFFSDLAALCTGQQVYLVKELFNGELCFRVVTYRGQTIGYVPKRSVAEVSGNNNQRWVLTFSNPNALPWERYVVSSC